MGFNMDCWLAPSPRNGMHSYSASDGAELLSKVPY